LFRTKSKKSDNADMARARADLLKEQAALLKLKASPAAAAATERAALATASAREWATPRLEKARARGVEVGAPRVESAAEALGPRVEAARDKIVEDILPRLVDIVAVAAAAAAAKTDEASGASRQKLADVQKSAKKAQAAPEPEHRRGAALGKAMVVVGALSAAGAAGYAAWRANQPTDDPWATATGSPKPSTAGAPITPSTPTAGAAESATAGSVLSEESLSDPVMTESVLADADAEPTGFPPSDPTVTDSALGDSDLDSGAADKVLEGEGDADLPGVGSEGKHAPKPGPSGGSDSNS